MPIAMPIQDLFADDFVTEAGIIERGKINLNNITNIDTDNFIEPGDKLYMPLFTEKSGKLVQDTSSFKSYNRDLLYTGSTPSSASEVIEIPIFYKVGTPRDLNDKHNTFTLTTDTIFKIGTYTISKSEDIIIVRINTHSNNHILNPRIYINSDTRNPDDPDDTVISENIYKEPFTYTNINGDEVEVIEAALPRDYFMNTVKTIKINAKNQNISSIRNVYPRLKSVEFTSK